MSEQRTAYTTTTANLPVRVTYVDDAPDVREYLVNLRRDLLRKVRDLDELIGRIDSAKPVTKYPEPLPEPPRPSDAMDRSSDRTVYSFP